MRKLDDLIEFLLKYFLNIFYLLQLNENSNYSLVDLVAALDASFTVSRDIGDQGPERMTPPRVAEYVKVVVVVVVVFFFIIYFIFFKIIFYTKILILVDIF